MTRFSPWVACWCLTLACQSPKPEPATPTHIAKPVPEPNSAVEPRGAASDALHVVADDATLVIRIQGSELRSGPMFGALTGLRDGIPQARQGLGIIQAGCGFDPLESIQEIVLSAKLQHRASQTEPLGRYNIDPRSASLALALDRPAEDVLRCIQNFIPVEQTDVLGNPAIRLPTGGLAQARRELLIYTPAARAEATAQRIRSGAPLSPGLQASVDSNPKAAFLAYARGPNPLSLKWGSLALSQPGGGFELKAVGLAETPEAASNVAQRLQEGIQQLKQELKAEVDSPSADQLAQIFDQAHIEQTGASLSVRLTLDKEQAERLFSEVLVGMAKEGVGKYQLAAKTAEARDNVMRIALALSDYARAQKPPKRPFPPSAPLTPAQVPQGRAVDATAGFEHASWKAIGFMPNEPLFYSYEFVTAPDGRSVEVIARGDLDADGEQSLYSVKVSMVGNEPKVDSEMKRERPYE